MKANARTVGVLKLLRKIGPLSKRYRMPKQQQPDGIRRDYYKAILPYTGKAKTAFHVVRDEVVRLLVDLRKEQGRTDHIGGANKMVASADAGGQKAKAKALVEQAQRRAVSNFNDQDLFGVAERFGKTTSNFQKEQLGKQVKAAMGIPFTSIEKPARDLIPAFAAENVQLIKTVPERYFDRIQAAIDDSFESGEHPDTLMERLQDIDDISDNDARRIARDQIGKLNGQLNMVRQQGLGATRFTWRTMNDDRVRDEHAELEGESFDWDDPPDEGIPGEPIQCRCYAEPDFSDILGEASDDDQPAPDEGEE